jgi:hypothetical protein
VVVEARRSDRRRLLLLEIVPCKQELASWVPRPCCWARRNMSWPRSSLQSWPVWVSTLLDIEDDGYCFCCCGVMDGRCFFVLLLMFIFLRTHIPKKLTKTGSMVLTIGTYSMFFGLPYAVGVVGLIAVHGTCSFNHQQRSREKRHGNLSISR